MKIIVDAVFGLKTNDEFQIFRKFSNFFKDFTMILELLRDFS